MKKKKKDREMHWIVQLEHLLTAGLWEKRPRQHFPKPAYWHSQHQRGRWVKPVQGTSIFRCRGSAEPSSWGGAALKHLAPFIPFIGSNFCAGERLPLHCNSQRSSEGDAGIWTPICLEIKELTFRFWKPPPCQGGAGCSMKNVLRLGRRKRVWGKI